MATDPDQGAAVTLRLSERLVIRGHSMDPEHRKEKVAKCRRLASSLSPGDPTREALLKLAEEYESTVEEFDEERHRDRSPDC
jgi:hypothetical protein